MSCFCNAASNVKIHSRWQQVNCFERETLLSGLGRTIKWERVSQLKFVCLRECCEITTRTIFREAAVSFPKTRRTTNSIEMHHTATAMLWGAFEIAINIRLSLNLKKPFTSDKGCLCYLWVVSEIYLRGWSVCVPSSSQSPMVIWSLSWAF